MTITLSRPHTSRVVHRSDPGQKRAVALGAATIAIWLLFHATTSGIFLTSRNLTNLAVQISMVTLVAMSLTTLLIAREMDLSAGALFALVTVASVLLQVKYSVNVYLAIAVCLALGVGIGVFQAAVTRVFKVPSFIVTLAAFSYLQGLAYVITNNETYAGTNDLFRGIANAYVSAKIMLIVLAVVLLTVIGYRARSRAARPDGGPTAFAMIQAKLLALVPLVVIALFVWAFLVGRGVPVPIVIVALWAAGYGYLLTFSRVGRHIYAIGGNPEAARRAGINRTRIVIGLFAASGFTVAVAGLIQASRLDSGPPNVGIFLALEGISAAIIGGTSLFGGAGSIRGTVMGAILLGSVQNGLGLMGLNSNIQVIATGLILLVVICGDSLFRGRRAEE